MTMKRDGERLRDRTASPSQPPDATARPGPEQLVATHYPAVATELLKPLLHLLSLSRDTCGGDVDKFLIMLVLALRTTEHPAFATLSQEHLLSGDQPVFPGLSTNVRSIAASLGLPRETVRRKVTELIETGWIWRERTALYFTATAYQQLVPVREAIELLAVRNFEVIAGLLAAQPDASTASLPIDGKSLRG
jgi:hypothetical protein